MKRPFIIYCRAVGIYALLTLPAMVLPPLYFISLMYVLLYGWIAWFVFTLFSLLFDVLSFDLVAKIFALFFAVVVAVAIAYQLMGVSGVERDIWQSEFILFPFIAVVSGWISVCASRKAIRASCYSQGESSHSIS